MSNIQKSAIVDKTVKIGDNVYIFENVEIAENCIIERQVQIYKNTKIGANVKIGEFSTIHNDVNIEKNLIIDNKSVIAAGVDLKNNFYYKGSMHIITYLGNNIIKIGCEVLDINWFLTNYKSLGIKNEYSTEQQQEYYEYVLMIKNNI